MSEVMENDMVHSIIGSIDELMVTCFSIVFACWIYWLFGYFWLVDCHGFFCRFWLVHFIVLCMGSSLFVVDVVYFIDFGYDSFRFFFVCLSQESIKFMMYSKKEKDSFTKIKTKHLPLDKCLYKADLFNRNKYYSEKIPGLESRSVCGWLEPQQ